MHKKLLAFTLMEIIIVIVLIGVVGAFGIANYTRGLRKGLERRAIGNLRLIRSAAQIYMANTGSNVPNLANINAINTTLGLNIVDNALLYQCGNSGGVDTSFCQTNPNGAAWQYHFHQSNAHLPMKIHCNTGANTCILCPFPQDCG